MTRARILRTIGLTTLVAGAAQVVDYLVNIVLLHDLAAYSPVSTLAISVVVALPLAFVLFGKQMDLTVAKRGLTATLQDREAAITETRDALSRLQSSETLYRLLADNLSDSLSLWDADGQRLYSSPSLEKLLGYTLNEYMTLPIDQGIHPEDFPRIAAVVKAMQPGDEPRPVEYRRARKDGTEVWLESTYTVLRHGGLISATRDITRRKHLELELMAALEQAQAAAAAKADFLANMTHELRTPLNAIVGFSEVLQRSGDLSSQDARHVDLVHDASLTLLEVVNDVLDFSRLEADGVDLDPQPFDPAELARSACALVQPQASAKGLRLDLTLDVARGPMVGDAPRLSRVLLNFLSNAIKFTGEGAVTVRVTQPASAGGAALRIEVADSGIGIPTEQIEGVFERFAQADAGVSRRFGGTGLGLAISKRIIDKMDGAIGVESRVGQGSTFWFELALPLADRLVETAAPEPVLADAETPLRLLLVEDNAVNRELIRAMLAPFDMVIDTAQDGVEGVEAARRAPYDLILMDVQMPVMDGLTATRRIRASETGERAPIVAMTANVLPDQIAKCLDAGMDDHLGKPVDLRRLLETVSRWTQPGTTAEAT
ncbi:MAG: response regulator [Caulobacter sp.]|nr:response regulator [Caulobacter sp.]